MKKPQLLKWNNAARLAFLAAVLSVSSASAQVVLFSDNFNINPALPGFTSNNNLDLNFDLADRQAGPLAPSTWFGITEHHQVGNLATYVGQPGGATAYGGGYVLLAFNGNMQNDLDIARASAGPLTIDFDMMMDPAHGGEWTAFSIRRPGSAFPITGGNGEFGFLQQNDGGVQLWDGGGSITPSGWNNAGFAPAQHWKFIFTDTAGTGSAFVGKGSKVTIINGANWTNTISIQQLLRSGLKFGFNASGSALDGVDNVVITGTQQAIAVTATNESGANPFTPDYTLDTPNLIAGLSPSTANGNFGAEGSGGTSVLTDGTVGTSGTIGGFATCGANAGNTLIYTLTNVVNGTDVTNIVLYSGWGDGGRFGQYYDVSYSTIAAPATWIPITTVFYLPGNTLPNTEGSVSGAPSARVKIAKFDGSPLASGVANIKFDFGAPPGAGNFNNGYQGYSEIVVQGNDTTAPPPPPSALLSQDILPAAVVTYAGDQVVFSATYTNYPPVAVQWQKITAGPVTNSINAGVVTVINNNAVTSTLTINNVQTTDAGIYRLEGLNATNGAAAPAFSTGAPLTVNNLPAPVNNVVVGISGQFGLGSISPVNASTNFYPTWVENTANDLILNSVDGVAFPGNPGEVYAGGGNFSPLGSACNGDPAILSDGSQGFQNSWPGIGGNQSLDAVGNNAGLSVIYTLPGSSATGWSLTNITVFGGWGDGGRDEQKYQVLYSTISAPTVFNNLISVDYNPAGVPANTPSAVRTVLTPASGAMAQNVYAIEFNFNNAGSGPENGWVGLSEIVVAGQPSAPVPVLLTNITPTTAEDVVGSSLILSASFSGATSYQWSKNGTNLPGATSSTLTINNLQLTDAATNGGYQLVAYNAAGSNVTTTCTVYVDPASAPVGNVVTAFAYQTSPSDGFSPTWDTSNLGASLIAGQNPPSGGYDTVGDFNDPDVTPNALNQAGGLTVLTDGNYGHFVNTGPHPAFAACGPGGPTPGAGNSVTYTLGANANGYDVTNIQVAGGWNDNGRDSQFYTVLYSTVANPTIFLPMVAVANNLSSGNTNGGGNLKAVPSGSGIQATIRATFTPASGVLAANVYAVQVDFQFPQGVPNGYSGYSEIDVFGAPSVAAPPAGPVITTAHEETNNTWTAETPNLIAGQLPSSGVPSGLIATNGEGCTAAGFTDGILSFGGNANSGMGGTDTNNSYQNIVFAPSNGGSWNLTNIVTYSLWHDFGRVGQFYNLSYSTTSNPTLFLPLASVAYDPFVPHDGRAVGNRVQIAPPVGQTLLASNVAAVKFDFTPEGTLDFAWSGYTEIILQGTSLASPIPIQPTLGKASVSGGNLILTGSGGTPGVAYSWVTSTNVTTPINNWLPVTGGSGNLDGSGAFSNAIPINAATPASFFRLKL